MQSTLVKSSDLSKMDRQSLVRMGSELSIPAVANMKTEDLIQKIVDLKGQTDPTKDIKAAEAEEKSAKRNTLLQSPEILEAKATYDEAKQAVKDAIIANQTAMAEFQLNKTDETKAAYAATRAAHKATITHIKTVRPIYKDLVKAALSTLED